MARRAETPKTGPGPSGKGEFGALGRLDAERGLVAGHGGRIPPGGPRWDPETGHGGQNLFWSGKFGPKTPKMGHLGCPELGTRKIPGSLWRTWSVWQIHLWAVEG